VQRDVYVGGDYSKLSWLEFISRVEVLFAHRSPEQMMRATKERLQLQASTAAIRGANQHTGLSRGVERPLKEFVDGAGRKVTVADWLEDPFQTPAPLASTLKAAHVDARGNDSAAAAVAPAAVAPGRNRQRNRGNRGGQKRGRSPSPPEDAAAAAAAPSDGRQSEAYREKQRQIASKRPRNEKGHYLPSVKGEQGARASGPNAAPLGPRPLRKDVDSNGAEVTIRGPCSSCGLNHPWDLCRRNPNSPKFQQEERGKTGLHYIAALDGYRLGDEKRIQKPSQPHHAAECWTSQQRWAAVTGHVAQQRRTNLLFNRSCATARD
jgi:hypothetical protein